MSRFFAIFFRHISIYIFSRENRCFTIEFGILVSTAKGTGDKQRVPRHPNNQLIKTNSLVLTMNSLFENYGLAPIAIQIISYLDVKSFLKVRGVNKTLLILIDNEQSLWRNALKNLLRSGPTEESKQEKMSGGCFSFMGCRCDNKCVCMPRWAKAVKPFSKSLDLEALKLLVHFIFELNQRHLIKGFYKGSCIHLNCWSRSPFYQACRFASPALLELIINNLAKTDDTTMEHRNVFEVACNSGRLEAVQLTWKIWKEQGIVFEQKSSKSPKPILCAYLSENPLIFQFVLDQDIDITDKGIWNGCLTETILHCMVGRANDRRYQEVSAVLLSYCKGKTIDWNVQDEFGYNPVLLP